MVLDGAQLGSKAFATPDLSPGIAAMIRELTRQTPAMLRRMVCFILEVIFLLSEPDPVFAAFVEAPAADALRFDAAVAPAADADVVFPEAPALRGAPVFPEVDVFPEAEAFFDAAALLCASVIRLFCSSVSLLLSAIGFFLPHPAGKQDAFT